MTLQGSDKLIYFFLFTELFHGFETVIALSLVKIVVFPVEL